MEPHKNEYLRNASIVSGTLRPQDLIPAFMIELATLNPSAYEQISCAAFPIPPAYALEDDDSKWWHSAQAARLLNEELVDLLQDEAPTGCYFGAHPGDGSDFGFWESDEESE